MKEDAKQTILILLIFFALSIVIFGTLLFHGGQ